MLDECQPIVEHVVANTPEFNGTRHCGRCSKNGAAVGVRAKNKVPSTAVRSTRPTHARLSCRRREQNAEQCTEQAQQRYAFHDRLPFGLTSLDWERASVRRTPLLNSVTFIL